LLFMPRAARKQPRYSGHDAECSANCEALDLAGFDPMDPPRMPLTLVPRAPPVNPESLYVYGYLAVNSIPEGGQLSNAEALAPRDNGHSVQSEEPASAPRSKTPGHRRTASCPTFEPAHYVEFTVVCSDSRVEEHKSQSSKKGHRRTHSLPPNFELIIRPVPGGSYSSAVSEAATESWSPEIELPLADPDVPQGPKPMPHKDLTPPMVSAPMPKKGAQGGSRGHRRTASEPPLSSLEIAKVSPYCCFNCSLRGHKSRDCPEPCSYCRKAGHWSGECPTLPKSGEHLPHVPLLCFNCNKSGHKSVDCPEPCTYCNGTDHLSKNCPVRRVK